jgi:hypothetical protein
MEANGMDTRGYGYGYGYAAGMARGMVKVDAALSRGRAARMNAAYRTRWRRWPPLWFVAGVCLGLALYRLCGGQ